MIAILDRVRAWRKRRAERLKELAERDPLTRWLTNLPPEDRKAVPDADTRPVRSRWKAATP